MIIFHEDSKNVDQKIYKLYYYYIKLIILYELIGYFLVCIPINSFLFVIVLNRCMIWKIVLIATPITHAWNDSTYKFGHAIYDIRLNIAFHTKICVVKNQVGTWKYVNVCLVSLNIIKHIMHVPLKGEYSSVYIL